VTQPIADHVDQRPSLESSLADVPVVVLTRTPTGWCPVRVADRLGLSEHDLGLLIAEEAEWWREQQERMESADDAAFDRRMDV
jgi:hypothetical protein